MTNGQASSNPDRPLRVAKVAACPFPYPRGTPIRAYRMAEALAARGHHVNVVTYHLGEAVKSEALEVSRIPDVWWYRKVSPGPSIRKLLLVDPILAVKLWQVLRADRFDVIHAHHYEGLLLALAARGRLPLPIVYDAHTALATELPHYSRLIPRSVSGLVGRLVDTVVPRFAEHTVAVTGSIRDYLVEHGVVDTANISVIGNGVEPEFLRRAGERRSIDEDRSVSLAFAGNLAPYQGIDLLLDIFRRVRDRHPDARLLLITESDFGPYERLAQELGVRYSVEVVRSDLTVLPRLLSTADVLLNPRPRCDGLPQKLLNYLAAGRPIVSFADSAPGLVHGQTALLAPTSDVDAFAGLVLRVLEQPLLADRLAERARAHAVEELSWERTASEIESLYRSLLGSPASGATAPGSSGGLTAEGSLGRRQAEGGP
ncbi:MAG: glycosyltransferase family 4 protein [Gemmatimonadota bacterium]